MLTFVIQPFGRNLLSRLSAYAHSEVSARAMLLHNALSIIGAALLWFILHAWAGADAAFCGLA
ncbi:MAG TPA: hypothetical protein PKX94_01405, partial [Opitutales bacterium]|nr:hypothetical protein [Opitutales bacterium]